MRITNSRCVIFYLLVRRSIYRQNIPSPYSPLKTDYQSKCVFLMIFSLILILKTI